MFVHFLYFSHCLARHVTGMINRVWGGSPVCLMMPPCVMWQLRLSGVDTLWLASLASHTKIRLRKELNWFACWFWILNVEWYHIEAFVNAQAFPLHMQRCGSLLWHPTRASLTDSNKSFRLIDTKSLSTRDGTMNEFTPWSCRMDASFHPLSTLTFCLAVYWRCGCLF